LKEEAPDRTMWRNRFGGGFEPVIRQYWIMNDDVYHLYKTISVGGLAHLSTIASTVDHICLCVYWNKIQNVILRVFNLFPSVWHRVTHSITMDVLDCCDSIGISIRHLQQFTECPCKDK
jgi:hypothetical protein